MKKSMITLVAIIMMAGISSNLMAQSTVITTASAKILTGLSIAKSADMSFGTMTSPTVSSTVILDPSGSRTSTGNITLLQQAPVASASAYTVTGDPNATYTITLPSYTNIILPNGPWLIVDGFISSIGLNETLPLSGTENFTVGATLHVNSWEAPGTYTGTFDVSVAYN